ncbi:hypothetical protein BU589_11495, partial [Staphylococcus agnetis]
SYSFVKNIINKRFTRYIVLLIISAVVMYLLSVEEQLFLVIFSIIIYLSIRLRSIGKLTNITKI